MLNSIEELIALGPLPSSDNPDLEHIEKAQQLLDSITPPISDDEAKELVKIFGQDECFGLAWSVLHLIETAPGWPLQECLEDTSNEWVRRLQARVANLSEKKGT